ncbi:Hypothetical predicted protein [Mytilus galloprovincialis]|uniref:Uncharacterized protein n=1 Tax=Mytilus galloprovincialis TaxID=29158 RepID=A0A8B6GG37_MYTGA|nr:Hypothetical predicted protein [Mytilus galloprovincialis]
MEKALKSLSKHPFGDHSQCNKSWCRFITDPQEVYKSLPNGKPIQDQKLKEILTEVFDSYINHAEKLASLGSTQANESFNKTVGSKAPKSHNYSRSDSLNYSVALILLELIETFLTNPSKCTIMGIDPTFNLGEFVVTPIVYKNLKLIHRRTGLDIGIRDIGQSHVIGKLKQGRYQVIVRFISYRTRQLVYSNKKALKGDPNGTIITENLTHFRTNLVKQLATLKYNNKINACWTTDGRIFIKVNANSQKRIINNLDDISDLESDIQQLEERTNTNNSDGM